MRCSRSEFLLSCALTAFSAIFLVDTIAWLGTARRLNEIGAQCAYSASLAGDLASARQAADKVLQSFKPDGLFLREPLTCDIVFYRVKPAGTESLPLPSAFVTVKTSVVSWIPFMIDANLVRFSALHSNPCLPLDDNTKRQNGRSSI